MAQGSSVLRLIVLEPGGQPVVGANVLIFEDDQEEYSEYGVTSKDGFVEFRDLATGEYVIRITYVGFKPFEKSVKLNGRGVTVERITLSDQVGQLGEIEVTGTGDFRTGDVGVTRIRGEEFSRVPSVGVEGDLMAYIQTLPGVVTVGDQGGDIFIRGGTPAQNLVLVDNIPLVKPFHISNLFSAFPERTVNNVSVMAGGFDNRYMNSTSSVIEVNLKPGNLNEASGAGSVSPYMTSLFAETPLKQGTSSLMMNGRFSNINTFENLLPGSQQDARFYDFIARYTHQGNDLACSATVVRTNDEGSINPTRNTSLSWSNTALGARCFGFQSSLKFPFELSMGVSDFRNSEQSPDRDLRFSKVTQGFLRLDSSQEFVKSKLDLGVNLMFQNYQASFDEIFQIFEEGLDVTDAIIQVYVKTARDISQNVTVEPGIGSQISSGYGLSLEPRIRMRWQPFGSEKTEISFATGYYTQAMEGITDERDAGSVFTLYRPNKDLESIPGAWHNILGFNFIPNASLSANAEVFFKKYVNVPVSKWTPQTGLNTDVTLAEGISYGADLSLEYNRRPVFLYAGYGYSFVEYSASEDNLGTWLGGESITKFNPAHDLRHKFNVIANYEISEFTLSVRWDIKSGLPYTQIAGTDLVLGIPSQNPINTPGVSNAYFDKPYTERLPAYHRLDFSVKRFFDISSGLRIGAELGAINIYDQTNIFYVDVAEFQVINQNGFLPYFSFSAEI
ncbi:MAG: TonB-dependent receptor [Balneolaceae bacterium]|nr:TonB-dependent receptor [Balneolaceae bacterium]